MKITNILLSFLVVGQAVLCQSCSNEEEPSVENLDLFQQKATELGIKLFKCAEQSSPDKNLILSPFDAQLALSMAANLPDTSFRNQVCRIFGYDNITQLNATNKYLIKQLTSPITIFQDEPPIITTKISNSVWSNNAIPRRNAKPIAKYYFADVNKGDLSSEEVAGDLKKWMRSSGIKMAQASIPENTDIAIFSLLYFNQEWNYNYHFSESYKDIFYTLQGEKPTAFMRAEINALYHANEKFESVILKLLKYQMICTLPVESSLSEAIKAFEVTDLYDIIEKAKSQDINIYFPVFKFRKQLDLNPLFNKCGFYMPSQRVKCEQTSTIEVDQTGVAAGSVTSLYCVLSAPCIENPIELKFNRPFMFFIIDPETKTLLFAGQCVGPVE
ncbi:MAG: hypothetical protein K2J10_09615 [Muribaculaceae bacterium]|nr:hypothetical protein [Muribaculaceae bacterium]